MSFGAFGLFNFFQQPNVRTGILPSLVDAGVQSIIFGPEDNQRSGTVADFNWYYPYAGTNYSLDLLIAPKQYHWIPLNADLFTGGSLGIRFSNAVSGDLLGKSDVNRLSSQIYAYLSPQKTGEYNISSLFSGLISGSHSNFISLDYNWSGRISGLEKDNEFFSSLLSGALGGAGSSSLIDSLFSGVIYEQSTGNIGFQNAFSGVFFPMTNDYLHSLSFGIESITAGENARIITISSGSVISSLNFDIINITTSNN